MAWKYQNTFSSTYARTEGVYPYQSRKEWKYSDVTPGYPAGKPYPSHVYYREGATLTPGSVDYQIFGSLNHVGVVWSYGGQYLPNPNIDWSGYYYGWVDNQPTAQTKAAAFANSNVRNARFDAHVFLGEFGETCRLLARDAGRILKAARAVKKGHWNKAAQELGIKPPKGVSIRRTFSDNWLKYQFGYKPIVNDMVNSAKAFTELGKRSSFVTITGRATASNRSNSPPISFSFGGPLGGGDGTYRNEFDVRWDCTVGYVVEITNPYLAELASLGLTNPIAATWELLPFSFVVDWFVNVGECLAGLDAWSGKRFVTGYQTDVCNLRVVGRISSKPRFVANAGFESSGSGYFATAFGDSELFELKRYIVQRNPLNGPVPPTVRFDLPDTLWHFVTSISLLQKFFK